MGRVLQQEGLHTLPPNAMQIHVKSAGGREAYIMASCDDTLESFFKKMEHIYGIPSASQVLLLEECALTLAEEPPSAPLRQYNLDAACRILLKQLCKCPDNSPPSKFPLDKTVSSKKSCAWKSKYAWKLPPRPAGQPVVMATPGEGKVADQNQTLANADVLEQTKADSRETGSSLVFAPSKPEEIAPITKATRINSPNSHMQRCSSDGHVSLAPSNVNSRIGATQPTSKQTDEAQRAKEQPLKTASINRAGAPPSAPGTKQVGAASMPRLPAVSASLSWSPPSTSTQAPAPLPVKPSELSPRGPKCSGSATPTAVAAPLSIGGQPGVARIRRCDLQRIGRLGVGAFGLVTLEAHKRTGLTYALKAVSKGYLAHLRMEYSVLNEKRILKMLESPFVVRLLATYNSREYVYFLLEAALGGELFTTYERLKLYGSEPHAKFYVGCVTEAFAHLHERNVIYRDLKPENLLLDNRGFCKLTDMGLAKITTGQTFTMVGTPDYMAPEVIDCTGHNKSVDWWTLGVLLFELLAGHAPFESKSGNAQETYTFVKRGIEAVRFPESIRPEAAHLVRALCLRAPEARMRTPKLREHNYFRAFDWQSLRAQRMTPPLIPQVRGDRDLTNFRNCEHEDPQAMPYEDSGSGWDIGFEDDVLTPQAAAAAALAPMLPAPTGASLTLPRSQGAAGLTTSTSSNSSSNPKAANAAQPNKVLASGSVLQPVREGAHSLQQAANVKRVGSPDCSLQSLSARQASSAGNYAPSATRLMPAVAAASAQNHGWDAWHQAVQKTSTTKSNSGSYVPPIMSSRSPPTSPVLGGC